MPGQAALQALILEKHVYPSEHQYLETPDSPRTNWFQLGLVGFPTNYICVVCQLGV